MLASLLFAVVDDLDGDDNHRADGGDDVGDDEGPVADEDALDDKEERAEAHHQEGGHGDALGVAGTDGDDSLGHVAQNHRDRSGPSEDGGPKFSVHGI